MKKSVLAILFTTTMLFAQYHYESSGSVEAKGGHSINGKSLINDVSDVYNFPSEAAATPDVAQGFVVYDPTNTTPSYMAGSAFVVKTLTDKLSAGLVFGKGTVVSASGMSDILGLGTGFGGGVIDQVNAVLPGHNFTGITAPSNNTHLVFGLKLSDNTKLGLDLYREASNSSYSNHLVNTNLINQRRTDDTERFVKYGALGVNGGVELKAGNLAIKATAGFANLGFNAENHTFGTDYNNTKLPDITNSIETESGLYIPATAKAQMEVGKQKITAGVDFFYASHAFIGKYVNTTGATTTSTEEKSDKYAVMSLSAGLLDEMPIGENTKVYASVVVGRTAITATPPDSVTNSDPEVTAYSTLMPKTSVGVEHTINKFWKFDQLVLRAGGFKTYSWLSTFSKGANGTEQEASGFPTSAQFQWTTGLGFVMGKVTIDLTVRPDHWNGVHLISGVGPYGGTVTMTYNY